MSIKPPALTLRKTWVKKLLQLFTKHLSVRTFAFDDLLDKAILVENAVFVSASRENTKDYRTLYVTILSALYANLDPADEVGDRFFMLKLLALPDEDMFELIQKNEIYWDEYNNKELIAMFEKNTDVVEEEAIPDSKLYRCKMCGSRQVPPPIQLQLRASDESSTLFFRCLKCKAQWKTEA